MSWTNELASRIRGEVLTSEDHLAANSSDFGRILERKPTAVVRAAKAADVVEVVKFAAARGLQVAPRGAGHSQNGLSLSNDILLDLTGLDRVISVDEQRPCVTCQAGITWRDLLSQLYPLGLSPAVLTNNLDVTVGGTVSTAGLGVASWKYGAQGGLCTEIEAVTGEGELVRCSNHSNQNLFDAVRSGAGWFGIITEVTIHLRRHKPRYTTFYLLYDDLAALHRDLVVMMDEERFDYLEAWCRPLPQGLVKAGGKWKPFSQWFFPLHCTMETDGRTLQGDRVLGSSPHKPHDKLSGLSFYKHTHTEEGELGDFFSRLDPLFDLWKEGGFWNLAHPWTECILPWDVSTQFVAQAIELIPPQALAGGHIILWPARETSANLPLFLRPEGKRVMGFGVLPSVPPKLLPRILPLLNGISQAAEKAGGKRYISGWLDFDAEEWKAHFGPSWPRIVELKRKFDPHGVFTPLPTQVY